MSLNGKQHHNWKGGRKAAVYRCCRKRVDQRRAFINSFKDKPCLDCGGIFPSYVMHFDHRDPTTKVASLSTLAVNNANRETVEAEIAKCDLVCSNCHHIRTHVQKQAIRAAIELKYAIRP